MKIESAVVAAHISHMVIAGKAAVHEPRPHCNYFPAAEVEGTGSSRRTYHDPVGALYVGIGAEELIGQIGCGVPHGGIWSYVDIAAVIAVVFVLHIGQRTVIVHKRVEGDIHFKSRLYLVLTQQRGKAAGAYPYKAFSALFLQPEAVNEAVVYGIPVNTE